MKKVSQFILILKFVFLNAAISHAGTWEIITHGGFDAAVSAWNKVALIFSDSNYTALFISVAVLGAIVLYLSVYAKIALGSKGNPLSGWGIPFMAGIVIYMAFIVPKDTVVIYDETLNRGPQAINNIPRGVATIAGLLNKIETGFTNIIWTASDPSTDYRIQAGGTGFNALGATSAGLYNLPYSFTATFENFIKDCVFVEMQRPGTSLDINKIQSGEQTYQDILMESANPAFYTVSYLEKTEGEPIACYVAAQKIASWMHNQNNLMPAIKAACALAGYDPTIAQSLNACINASDNLVGRLIDNQTVGSLTGFARQALFAQVTVNVTTSINPNLAIKALATSQSMSSFIGMGVHANSWIPVIKETLSALAVGLVPLFAIVCVTPLAGKAFSIMAGMFIWLTVWGIVDSVIHSFAMEFAYKSAESLKISGGTSGLASMLMFPSYTAKIGALFGAVRWFGLMLSSIITAMFLRFGGTAMAMLAGSLSGTVQAAGASYGAAMYRTPGSVFSGEVVPTQSLHNAAAVAGGVNKLAEGLAQQQGGSMAGQARLGLRYGSSGIAQSSFLSGIESTERGLALGTPENAAMVGSVAGGSAVGGARGQIYTSGKHGISVEQMGFLNSIGVSLKHDTVESTLTKTALGSDGKHRVIGTKADLITASIQNAVERSKAAIYDKVYQTVQKWSIDEAKQWFNEHRDQLSDGVRHSLESIFRNSTDITRGSSNSVDKTNYIEGGGSFNVKAGFGGSGQGGGTNESLGIGVSYRHSAGERQSSTSSEYSDWRKGFSRIIGDSLIGDVGRDSVDSWGNKYQKMFSKSEDFSDTVKAAQQYKELESLKESIGVNSLNLLVQKIADIEFADKPYIGIDNRFDLAMHKIIQDVHQGNVSGYVQILNELNRQKFSDQLAPDNNIVGEVNNRIEEKQNIQNQLEKTMPKSPVKIGERVLADEFDRKVSEMMDNKPNIFNKHTLIRSRRK